MTSCIIHCAAIHNNPLTWSAVIKLSAAHDRVRGQSETCFVNILSPDSERQGREHGMLLQYVICSCIFFQLSPLHLLGGGSCAVGMQWNGSSVELWAMACHTVTSLACWLFGCWRSSPMFGAVGVSRLWNRVRMQKVELQLQQTAGFWSKFVIQIPL